MSQLQGLFQRSSEDWRKFGDRGGGFDARGSHWKPIECYRQCLQLNPEDALAWIEFGREGAALSLVGVSDIFYFFCSGEGKGESEAPGVWGGDFFFIGKSQRGGGVSRAQRTLPY